ncbi:hypothetical protein CR513_20843, partial [Mucuna pruriens]
MNEPPKHPEDKSVKNKRAKGKEALITSRIEVKGVLLARRELLYLLPTNICFHVYSPLSILLVGFKEMLESFKELFSKDILRGLSPIKGIEHHVDFTLGATLPNRAAYRANLEENREIQEQVGKFVKKGWVRESQSPCTVPMILVPKKDGF